MRHIEIFEREMQATRVESPIPPLRFRKNYKMIKVEQRLGRESIDVFLRRSYLAESMSLDRIGKALEISSTTVKRWIKITCPDIQLRDPNYRTPEWKKLQMEGIRAVWNDPEKRGKMIEKMQAPKARARRSKALKNRLKLDPEARKKIQEWSEKGRSTQKANTSAKIKEALGDNPAAILSRMVKVEGLMLPEIRIKLGGKLSIEIIRELLKENVIVPNKKAVNRIGITDIEMKKRKKIVRRAIQANLLNKLTVGQRNVILSLYPQGKRKPKPIEVASALELKKQRVSQLDASGIKKLNKLLEKAS